MKLCPNVGSAGDVVIMLPIYILHSSTAGHWTVGGGTYSSSKYTLLHIYSLGATAADRVLERMGVKVADGC